MSVKIYNGFRLTTNDFAEIHRHLMDWRAELRPLRRDRLAEVKANFAVGLLDGATCFPDEYARKYPTPESRRHLSPYMHADDVVMKLELKVKQEQRRIPLVDFEFEVVLMPFEGRVYGIVYTQQEEWRRLWMEKPFVEEYGFWDNTDEPEEIDPAEWAERERVWSGIMAADDEGIPAMLGYSAACTREFEFVDVEDVLAKAPPLEDRAARVAEHAVLKARLVEETASLPDPADKEAREEAGRRCRRWLRTDEGKAALAAETERMKGVLRHPLTRGDLTDDLVLPEPPAPAGGDAGPAPAP